MHSYEAGLQASDGRHEALLIAGISQDLFTEQVRFVLRLAQEEARHFQHHSIGTHHLLLGLLGEEKGVAARVLTSLGVDLPKVRHAVAFIVGHGYGSPAGSLPLTPRAQRVIKLALGEAKRMDQHATSTEHLLLGLVLEGEGTAAGILESLGVSLEKVRKQTREAMSPFDMPDGSTFALRSEYSDECDLEERRTISERIDDILFDLKLAAKFLGGAVLSVVALLWALGVVAFSLIVVLLFLIVDAALLLNIRASSSNRDLVLDLEFFWDMTREALEVAAGCLVTVPLLAGMILGWLAATLWISAMGIFHLILLLLDLFSEG